MDINSLQTTGHRTVDTGNYSRNNMIRNESMGTVTGQSSIHSSSVSTFTLHGVGDAEKGDVLLGAMAGRDNSSVSVFKTENFDPANPMYKVKKWDANGNETEEMVDILKVNPENCSSLEMYAYSCYLTDSGKYSEAQDTFCKLRSFSDDNLDNVINWSQLGKEIMQMQYDGGNLEGYLRYKKFYEFTSDK